VLKAAGIDAVSVANNHSLDFGEEALLDMLVSLDTQGIAHAGAGADLEEAMRPALSVTREGIRVGVLACTDNEPGWAAGEARAGVWFVPAIPTDGRAQELLRQLGRLRGVSDFRIVSLHWGSNWGENPEPGHRELARAVIAAGADLVFGHSCHVFRGVEVQGTTVVVYGAGDFIDDYAVDEVERNDRCLLFILELAQGRPDRLRLQPTVIHDLQARLAVDEERAAILGRMRSLSRELGTDVLTDNGLGTVALQPTGGRQEPWSIPRQDRSHPDPMP
jgi:poly-gamma-glutamate synthesis protein (capsule biosynthesis protein)